MKNDDVVNTVFINANLQEKVQLERKVRWWRIVATVAMITQILTVITYEILLHYAHRH